MSEEITTTDSGEKPTGDEGSKTTDKDTDFVSKAKFEALEAKMFRAGRQLDANKETVKTLNAQIAEFKTTKDEDEATSAIRESARADIAAAHAERDEAITSSRSATVKAEVMSEAEALVIDKVDFWNHYHSKYSAGENPDGTYSAEVKDSLMTLKESIEAYCAEKPHNAKAQKPSGAGVPGKTQTTKASQVTQIKDLANMSGPEKQRALINNPELMKAAEKLF